MSRGRFYTLYYKFKLQTTTSELDKIEVQSIRKNEIRTLLFKLSNQPTYLPTYRCVSQSPRFNISHPNDILLTYFLYTGVHFRVFDASRRIGNNDVSWKRRKEKRFLNFALRHFSSLKVSTDDDNRYFGFALTNRSHDWKIIGFCFVVVCVFELR